MSRGGRSGGSSPTIQSSTVKEHSLPSYARPYFEELLGRTAYEATRPYETYGGQRLADFDPYETAAMQGMEGMAAQGSPGQFLSASDIATNVGYQPTGAGMDITSQFQPQAIASQYQGANIDTGFVPGTVADPETLQRYMSPYQQMVTDVEKREARRQSEIMGGQMGQQAAQAGGLGGYREAIMQAERERNLSQQLGDIQTRGSQAGFQQAQQAFEADRAARQQAGAMGMTAQDIEDRGRQAADQARLGAERFNIEAQRQRGELGLRGLAADQATTGQSLDAARMLGAFGQQQQTMDYERLKNLQAAGQIRRDLGQQGLTMGYQDFQRQQAFPREQLGLYSTMLQGLPVTPGGQLTTYGGPSQYQQLLGTGIGGVGLYNAMNRPTGLPRGLGLR